MHNIIHIWTLNKEDSEKKSFYYQHNSQTITSHIYEGINNREMTVACFIDMAKAFDTVNHNILCKQLDRLGIKGILAKCFLHYLSNRKQCRPTSVNDNTSSYHNIVCWVQQGSILRPLLFIVYMNDLRNICNYSNYLLYADDTVIYLLYI